MLSFLYKHKTHLSIFLPMATALFALLMSAGCRNVELVSQWRSGDVTVDGVNAEWVGRTSYLEDEEIIIGLKNDEEFLYVALITSSRSAQAQVMLSGLTLWFDPAGEKIKWLGLHYPLAMEGTMAKPDDFRDAGGPGRGGGGDDAGPAQDRFDEFWESRTEMEITLPEKRGHFKVPISEAEGLELAMSRSRGVVVYELKIPLKKTADHPYAVGAEPGQTIRLGLYSPESRRPNGMPGSGGGVRGGGGMGGGSRPGGAVPPGGGPGGGFFERPEPIDLWITVTLAAEESPTSN